MTSPKSFKRYAGQWLNLFMAMQDDPHKVRIFNCPTKKAAQAMRSEFYKARTAFLSDEGARQEYEAILNSREVLIRGTSVVFEFKDNNWIGKLIEQGLNEQEPHNEQ